MRKREGETDCIGMFAAEIASHWFNKRAALLLKTVLRLNKNKRLARRVTHRVVREWNTLSSEERSSVATCLGAFVTLLWIKGDHTLEKLLIARFHRDFPEEKLQQMHKWASEPTPKPRGIDIIDAGWYRSLLRLAYYTGGKDARRLVKTADSRFSECTHMLLRRPIAESTKS